MKALEMKEYPDWADLPYFLAVARHGTLRSAAQHLGSTHATVSRHLENLEKAYGVRLFDRSVEGLALSVAGHELLPIAQQAELSILGARRKMRGLDQEAAGSVCISVPPFLAYDVLAPIFADFSRLHPHIDVEVVITDKFHDLNRGEADISLRVAYEVSDDVLGRKVLQYWSGLYASKSYIETEIPNAGPKGEGLVWTGWGEENPYPEWLKDSPFPNAKLRHSVQEGILQMHMVASGMGMSYLPCLAEHLMPELRQVPGTEPFLDRSIWLLRHTDLKNTVRVRLLVDFLADAFKKRRHMFAPPAKTES